MHKLTNHLSREAAMKKIAAETIGRQTLSFYRYVMISDPKKLRDQLFVDFEKLGVLGRIYLAEEGINAQISLPLNNVQALRLYLDSTIFFKDIPFKKAIEEPADSFWKLTIKVRKQIVADNLPPGTYDITNVGRHLNAEAFHEAIEKGALVVDMRNKYESDIGHFVNAITTKQQRFSDELLEVTEKLQDKKTEKILLYCTGGIRCEKASAYLKHQGFTDVNQLHGGIINYKHEIDEKNIPSKFIGKNFVFDGRMAEAVTDDILGKCYNCQKPADSYDNCKSDLCHALFIQCKDCKEKLLGTCSDDCKKIVSLPIEERKKMRKGKKAKFKIVSAL